ncbi:hypothetical protein [uncultured Algibacter sp.]|uniref:hypothetical protein n=1 Tax=uncultured Algibacter sp. TaxID=298659 RepID=UPI0032174F25
MKKNSKEQIKNRMLKKAATLWGVPANEIEMSFDPVISLLLSACAAEIEKISGEIDESQTRITEKIIQLMTPSSVFGPKPAHAILYTEPVDPFLSINSDYMFSYKKKTSFKNTSVNFKDIYFSPLQSFNLVKGNIKYMASGNSISEFGKKKQFDTIFKGSKSSRLKEATLYLGISTDLESLPLNDTSFYFELQDIDDNAVFYHHLKNAEWYIGDKKIDTSGGFFNTIEKTKLNLDSIFNESSNKTNNIIEQIRNNYSRHYITIKTKNKGFKKSIFPELEQIITKQKVKIDEQITWIKIVFPRIINSNMLENVYVSLNALPIMNRELKSFSYQMKEYINILPIKTENLFLDVKSISNTSGQDYKLQNKNTSGSEKGIFSIRTDNTGKIYHRKAKEYITHLIELLKDESASFSFFNNDFLHKNLKNLNQLISLLENKVAEISTEVTETSYVSLRPFKKKENLLIDYWSTDGEEGNNIKSGSPLKIYNGIGIKQKSSYLVSSTFGGKNDLSMDERLNSYRRALLSRDRIVTREDVKALCYEMYNDKITNVQVSKGYTTDIALKKGLIQCINIELTPNDDIDTELYEWNSLNNNLLLYLEKHSVSVFPYKVILKTE